MQCADWQGRCVAVALLLHALLACCEPIHVLMLLPACFTSMPSIRFMPAQLVPGCICKTASRLGAPGELKDRWRTMTIHVLINKSVLQLWDCRPLIHTCHVCLLILWMLLSHSASKTALDCKCQLLVSKFAAGFPSMPSGRLLPCQLVLHLICSYEVCFLQSWGCCHLCSLISCHYLHSECDTELFRWHCQRLQL